MPMSPFDLDDVTNLVQRDGIAARLSEQEKRLLVLLAARAGTALDKHALMSALWGKRAQWMEDAALVQLVSRLRRSLAPLGLQRAIVTVARVGYRFDAPSSVAVTISDTNSADDVARETSPVSADSSHDGVTVVDATTSASCAPPLSHGVACDGHGEVRRHGVIVRIPQIEYRLLCALRSPANVAHDKRTLIATLWPTRPDQDDTNLMQVVSRLRRKLIPLGLHRHIVTVPRIGYRFEPCIEADTAPMSEAPGTSSTSSPPSSTGRPDRLRDWLPTTLPRALRTLTRHLRWRSR
ncbi:winged helix-turn-helix domain-containing protein [Pandoraea commovens]|uniref:Winged helix-turn-helix domain-containing protein n=1 Tax=Pandoraea commovens TaxID=2508289 RepID=A0ABY5QL58_9BURK|nr:winged helix-turn-helix domain-containing protein [Pandoraea commovens]UVA81542.1 winged helix-turn-helix domain-containing protein [Pandoraea commovens]